MGTMASTVIFLNPPESLNVKELASELGLSPEMYSVREGSSLAGVWDSRLLITSEMIDWEKIQAAKATMSRYPYQLEELPVVVSIKGVDFSPNGEVSILRDWIIDNLY